MALGAMSPMPSTSFAQRREELSVAIPGRIFVQIGLDKSGSFSHRNDETDRATHKLRDAIWVHKDLRPKVKLAVTTMSSLVSSTGYLAVNSKVLPDLRAGGTSPFGLFIEEMVKTDVAVGANANDLFAHVIIGDWQSSDDLSQPLEWYHHHQREFVAPVHTFLVNIGGEGINHEVANRVSIKHLPYNGSDDAIEEVMALILGLIQRASVEGHAALNAMPSIDFASMGRRPGMGE